MTEREMSTVLSRGVSDAPLPVRYEAAKKALAACADVDECATWAKKAAALASYAKQANDETLEQTARRIRARAVRRCGELLDEIPKVAAGRKSVDAPPPISPRAQAARDAGLSRDQMFDALSVARIPPEDFEAAVESPKPPTVAELADRGTRKVTPLVNIEGRDPEDFNRSLQVGGAIRDLAASVRNLKPDAFVRGCLPRHRSEIEQAAVAVTEWLGAVLDILEDA